MEDELWWKTTFDLRRPSTEETFDGRRTLMEDDLWLKMTFNGKQPLTEDWHFGMTKRKDQRKYAPKFLLSYFSWSLTMETKSCFGLILDTIPFSMINCILGKAISKRTKQKEIWAPVVCFLTCFNTLA